MQPHVAVRDDRTTYDLGAIGFRILADRGQTGGSFSVMEFTGSVGPWTVPHIHEHMEESFYVLEGSFTFALDDREVLVGSGAFIVVPRGTAHMMRGEEDGARLLTIATPGGLEAMFKELATLPPGAITDPQVRARIASRYDSKPVSASQAG